MSKTKAAKRKRVSQAIDSRKRIASPSTTTQFGLPESLSVEPKRLDTIFSSEEIEITLSTLETLTEYPQLIKSKACKDLRVAVYNFKQTCTTGRNATADTSLTARISAALTDGEYEDALVALAEMRIRHRESPKLGALCRWVRDLDVVSGLSSMHSASTSKSRVARSEKELTALRVLDSILRLTGPADMHWSGSTPSSTHPFKVQKTWSLRDDSRPQLQVRESVLDKTIFTHCSSDIKEKFQSIDFTPGSLRRPPNLHPAVVYLTSENAVPLSATSPKTSYHSHPTIGNLSMIRDVLSADECKSIVAATETIGFHPDAPIKDEGSDSSILAHNVYWLIDQTFHDTLWDRVRPYIPTVVEGKAVRGINRRFRVYRYVPLAEYRCHIDGAWPPSGVNSTSKAYVYDASPSDARQSSRYTFLIYLNDEFEGGETTFFLPSLEEGIMNAYPVQPVMGSVAVFPHGDTMGALLHEGTGVRNGAKYVIRTDVEFDVAAAEKDGDNCTKQT